MLHTTPTFIKGLLGFHGPLPQPWDYTDATKLLTAITFAGLGGVWILFYSYWMRDKANFYIHYTLVKCRYLNDGSDRLQR